MIVTDNLVSTTPIFFTINAETTGVSSTELNSDLLYMEPGRLGTPGEADSRFIHYRVRPRSLPRGCSCLPNERKRARWLLEKLTPSSP